MDPILTSLVLLSTVAGYGDVDTAGYPSWSERDMHLWTNAARVDPEAFEADYSIGGCSFRDFSRDEQTPRPPLYLNGGLNEVARLHSEDMAVNDFFSHSSSDGTSFSDRVLAYYDAYTIGENIAWGYGDARTAVLQGWMCSTEGHRENIMSGDYTELGTGVVGDYYTQDFGGASITPPGPVAMATHTPESPAREVTFLADWQDAAAPAAYAVVLDGTAYDLALTYGTDTQGVFSVTVGWDNTVTDCAPYYFRWTDADGASGTFPEAGSYLLGKGCTEPTLWTDSQAGGGDGALSDWVEEDEDGKGGCQSAGAGAPALLGALAGLLALVGRQRRGILG